LAKGHLCNWQDYSLQERSTHALVVDATAVLPVVTTVAVLAFTERGQWLGMLVAI